MVILACVNQTAKFKYSLIRMDSGPKPFGLVRVHCMYSTACVFACVSNIVTTIGCASIKKREIFARKSSSGQNAFCNVIFKLVLCKSVMKANAYPLTNFVFIVVAWAESNWNGLGFQEQSTSHLCCGRLLVFHIFIARPVCPLHGLSYLVSFPPHVLLGSQVLR